jgi:hypothetical protein
MAVCVVSALLLLRFMGQPWWCACGGWSPWSGEINSQHSSRHLFDYYSATQVLHGFLIWWGLYWLSPRPPERWLLPAAVLIETLWEVTENLPFIINRNRQATFALGYEGDSVLNSLCDILCATVGFVIARRLGWTWGVAVFVGVELALRWLIREKLPLNIQLLLIPLPGLKAWQMGG